MAALAARHVRGGRSGSGEAAARVRHAHVHVVAGPAERDCLDVLLASSDHTMRARAGFVSAAVHAQRVDAAGGVPRLEHQAVPRPRLGVGDERGDIGRDLTDVPAALGFGVVRCRLGDAERLGLLAGSEVAAAQRSTALGSAHGWHSAGGKHSCHPCCAPRRKLGLPAPGHLKHD
jgi:hypothetical protein